MSLTDRDLLNEFTREPGSASSQDAFTELVNRQLNLVYSAALRQVRSPQLAEEVSQSVFTRLASEAARLRSDVILSAWLYQVTRNAAIDVIRREARRQAREQLAYQMSQLNQTSDDWSRIDPLIDEAMQSLDETDRTALLLRFFEYKSLREVGMELGFSEDAAQKRVSRALEDLREYFSKRKISVGAAGLAALLSVHGVQAAPFGLAAVIAAGSTAGASALSSSTAFAATKTIAMTTLQKTVVTSAATIAIAVGIYQAAQVSNLRTQIETLRSQEERQQVTSSNELHALRMERDQATNALAAISSHNIRKGPDEVLHLRGEVGRLQREKEEIGAASPLSKVTANPQFRNAMRDQQKQAMTMVYAGFAKLNKLGPEQTEKLDNLLADDIMENVDLVTTSLRDKPSADQLNQIFAGQEAALQQKVQELLGPDAAAQFQDYTKNLFSTISSEQFKGELSGDDASRNAKAKQLAALIQQQVQTALAASGLSPDYQVVPMLNFRNIASQDQGDQSLALMDTIYQQTISQASSFLSADELEKFRKFVATALNNNRNALTLNRSLMAPLSN